MALDDQELDLSRDQVSSGSDDEELLEAFNDVILDDQPEKYVSDLG
jgi:hypothetical protein